MSADASPLHAHLTLLLDSADVLCAPYVSASAFLHKNSSEADLCLCGPKEIAQALQQWKRWAESQLSLSVTLCQIEQQSG